MKDCKEFKIEDHTYRPLPEYLVIQRSPIEGSGLFTMIDIDPGEILGISHYCLGGPEYLVRTPLGGFINHSDDPNASLYKIDGPITDTYEIQAFHLVVQRWVAPGEEITLDYSKELCGICSYEAEEEEPVELHLSREEILTLLADIDLSTYNWLNWDISEKYVQLKPMSTKEVDYLDGGLAGTIKTSAVFSSKIGELSLNELKDFYERVQHEIRQNSRVLPR